VVDTGLRSSSDLRQCSSISGLADFHLPYLNLHCTQNYDYYWHSYTSYHWTWKNVTLSLSSFQNWQEVLSSVTQSSEKTWNLSFSFHQDVLLNPQVPWYVGWHANPLELGKAEASKNKKAIAWPSNLWVCFGPKSGLLYASNTLFSQDRAEAQLSGWHCLVQPRGREPEVFSNTWLWKCPETRSHCPILDFHWDYKQDSNHVIGYTLCNSQYDLTIANDELRKKLQDFHLSTWHSTSLKWS
jgi:hypothetical protein